MNFFAALIASSLVLSMPLQAQQEGSVTALLLADAVAVAEEVNSDSYERSLFKHWIDADGDGCDTRQEVLILESKVRLSPGTNCKVSVGKWTSLYENKIITNASLVDIDHTVPLKEAWESGASSWTDVEREAFANDLDFPGSLMAVSASINRSKGDRDPSQWIPTNKAFLCSYAVTWLQVKYRWSLTINATEKTALKKQLSTCPKTKKYMLPTKYVFLQPEDGANSNSPSTVSNDPRFDSCSAAKAAGYGPYRQGADEEYGWYRDGDGDGVVCE